MGHLWVASPVARPFPRLRSGQAWPCVARSSSPCLVQKPPETAPYIFRTNLTCKNRQNVLSCLLQRLPLHLCSLIVGWAGCPGPDMDVGGLEVDMMVRMTTSNVLRRITTLLIICCLLTVGLCVNTAAALPGSGTQEDPWRIESLADFDEFAADPNYWAGFTRLETDVNLAGRTYTTAVIAPDMDSSTDWHQGTKFTGVFDGNDHKITGLTIDDGGAGNDYLGLFGLIIDLGEVKNLRLEGGSISGDYLVGGLVGANGDWYGPGGAITNCYSTADVNGNDYVGGLVGYNTSDSTISDCYSTGDVTGDKRVGGLVGENVGSVSNCYSTGDVNGVGYVGGLVGVNYDWPRPNLGTISNCYSTGSVSGDSCVGGLAGYNDDSAISDCYSTGDVNGVADVGGLLGNNWGSVSNCYATGDVTGDKWVAGLVGCNGGSISHCYSTGNVSGVGLSWWGGVGGLVGINDGRMLPPHPGYIINSYSTGDVNGVGYVGGLVGFNSGTVSNCYSIGDVSGDDCVGGLAGCNGDFTMGAYAPGYIFNSYSIGDVNGEGNVGGLVGYNYSGSVSDCYSMADVNGYFEVGGMVGGNGASISNCYCAGDVNGVEDVGGLAGRNGASISNCYCAGDVSGVEDVGGLVGQNGVWNPRGQTWIPGYISYSYSTGSVQGTSGVGGLVGSNSAGAIERSFWDVETSGEPNMCGYQDEQHATGCDPNCGKTTAEMQRKSTFTEAGWDFVEIWLINEGATYPVLRQEIRSDLNGNGGVNMLDFAIFADHWLEGKDE